MTGFSPVEAAALDRATVPPMRAGLARDIVAAAGTRTRRGSRGGWRRHGRVLLGAGALVIASATAAATGLLDKLPIRIPGVTRVAEAPKPKPVHVARAVKPRIAAGPTVTLADMPLATVPLIDPPTADAPAPGQWRERRAARIAAGLPVRPTLMQRAIAAKIRALPPAERAAARAEWRRIKTLPPAERKAAIAGVKADFLARHPKMAERYEARLEARSAAAARGPGDPVATPAAPPVVTDLPRANRPGTREERLGALTPEQRAARRQWLGTDAGMLTPDQRAERRAQLRAWRAERQAQGALRGQGGRWRRAGADTATPSPLR